MSMSTISILGAIFSLAAAILSFIFIIPDKRKLNPFFSFLRNLFNFKDLWLEKIFKFLYVLSTCFCIIGGFFMLFYVEEIYHPGYFGYYYYEGYWTKEWYGYYGLLLMFLGPIVVRISYEFIMMAIIAVKNIIQINQNVQKIAPAEDVALDIPAENFDTEYKM